MECKGLEDVKVTDVLELLLALFPGSAHSPLSFFPPQNEESTAKEVVKAIETAESDYQVGGGWWVVGGGWITLTARWEPKLYPLCHSFTTACTRTNYSCHVKVLQSGSYTLDSYLVECTHLNDQSTNTNNNAVVLVWSLLMLTSITTMKLHWSLCDYQY